MPDLINKIRQVVEDGLETARYNAQNLKEAAEEYSRTTRIKFELYQLRNSLKKKIHLLGETVLPYLMEDNLKGLKKHETLPVLIDSIKSLQNEIILAEKSLQEEIEKKDREQTGEDVKKKIENLEQEIEEHIGEIQQAKKDGKKP